jgi:hypothetical protein
VIETGGGTFDRENRNFVFLAANIDRLQHAAKVHPYILIPINELYHDDSLPWLRNWAKDGKLIFIDSGVFNLAVMNSERLDIPLYEAMGLDPDQCPNFEVLFDRYVRVVEEFEDQIWGYCEIDQGGTVNKIKIRNRLEALGLRPMPVYHPLLDGWDYFDELCQNYDRICVGNVVQSSYSFRRAIMATLWERKTRQYPDVWIHMLGMTPSELFNAYPMDSGDSSTWLASIKWSSGYRPAVDGKGFGMLPNEFKYKLKSQPASPIGSHKACAMAGFGAYTLQRNWHNHIGEVNDLGDYESALSADSNWRTS